VRSALAQMFDFSFVYIFRLKTADAANPLRDLPKLFQLNALKVSQIGFFTVDPQQ